MIKVLVRFNSDQTFRSFHTRVDKGGQHFQVAGKTAEEIERSLEQLDERGSFFFHSSEGDRGVLIEAKDGLVHQHNVGPASLPHLNPVAGTVGVV